METPPVCVVVADGLIQAQVMRSFLEDAGLTVHLQGEAVAGIYGMVGGMLGAVQVLVPAAQADQAREVLADFDAGAWSAADDEDSDDEWQADGETAGEP